jgi:GxxExxY protein
MGRLIHPKLSYSVRGVLLNVHNALGPLLKEAYYRDAIAIGLNGRGIRCVTEKAFEVYYRDERVGLYFVDVWIEDGKLLLELKVSPSIEGIHRAQAISYLKVTNADLAIVVSYGGASLMDERLPNFLAERQTDFVWQLQAGADGLLHPELVNEILRACYRVHRRLGPGFLHQVYRRATMIELRHQGLDYDYIKRRPVEYRGQLLGYQDVRLILVEGCVVLATFALKEVDDALVERMKGNLVFLDARLGLLANFYGARPVVTPVRVG